jgi:hypothetical protein
MTRYPSGRRHLSTSPWGKRRRTVYGYDVTDLRNGRVHRAAYIGKTSAPLFYRDTQHRASQPWAWAIVGPIRPLWQADCGRIRLWVMEALFIVVKRPLFNYQWNKHNPRRIPIYQARRMYEAQREAYRTPR